MAFGVRRPRKTYLEPRRQQINRFQIPSTLHNSLSLLYDCVMASRGSVRLPYTIVKVYNEDYNEMARSLPKGYVLTSESWTKDRVRGKGPERGDVYKPNDSRSPHPFPPSLTQLASLPYGDAAVSGSEYIKGTVTEDVKGLDRHSSHCSMLRDSTNNIDSLGRTKMLN